MRPRCSLGGVLDFPTPRPLLRVGARCPARHESGKAASLSNTEGFGTLRVAPERATVQICGCVYSCVEDNSLVRYTKCTAISSQSRRFTCFPACKAIGEYSVSTRRPGSL